MNRSGWPALLLRSLLLGAILAACQPAGAQPGPSTGPSNREAAPERRSMVFMAGYRPQANLPFVVAYVAQQHGLFAAQGLDVDIRHAVTGEHLQLLLAGQVQVTTAAADSVLKRIADLGVPIRAIALFGQTGDQAFMSLAESGLANPKDWEGKTVGYKLYPGPEYLAILHAAGVDRAKISEVEVGFDPRILLAGRVDVLPVFAANEPHLLERLGARVIVTRPADFGIETLGLTYITTEDLLAREPDLLQRFLKATMKAAAMVAENPEIGVDAVMAVVPEDDRDHQRQMLLTELAEARVPVASEGGIGWMTPEQWQTLHDSLVRFGGLSQPIDPARAYTRQVLESIYENGRLRWP